MTSMTFRNVMLSDEFLTLFSKTLWIFPRAANSKRHKRHMTFRISPMTFR